MMWIADLPFDDNNEFGFDIKTEPDWWDPVIWRYINFTKFVALIANQELFFTRASMFDDPWEGLFPTPHRKYIQRVIGDGLTFAEHYAAVEIYNRQGAMVNCWHKGDTESDAMWRLYALAPDGVAIRSTYFFETFSSCL